MELLKGKDNLTFSVGDVKFFIRASATVRDKFAVDMTGTYENGVFKMDRVAFYHKMIELFVEGWDGVTMDGKPVPYIFATFMDSFPADPTQDVVLKLGSFIATETGIFPAGADDSKNA
jgi:hypothetical protein